MVPSECEIYLEQVEHMLYCEQADKNRLLSGFRQEMLESFSDASELTEAQIIQHYGSPEAVAQELQAALPTSNIMKMSQRHKLRMWLGIIAAVLAVVLACSYIAWQNKIDVTYIDKEIIGASK